MIPGLASPVIVKCKYLKILFVLCRRIMTLEHRLAARSVIYYLQIVMILQHIIDTDAAKSVLMVEFNLI